MRTFLITICPLSVVGGGVVVVTFNMFFFFLPRSTGPSLTKLKTNLLEKRRFKFVLTKGPALLQEEIITKEWKYIDDILKICFSKTTVLFFHQIVHKVPLGDRYFSLSEFQGNIQYYEIAKIHRQNLNRFFRFS